MSQSGFEDYDRAPRVGATKHPQTTILNSSNEVLSLSTSLVEKLESLRDKIRGVNGISPVAKEPESKGLGNMLETSIRKLNEAVRLSDELHEMF